MTKVPLPIGTQGGWTDLIIIKADTDLTETATATAQTLAIRNVLAGEALLAAAVVVKTALSDASDAAFNTNTLKIGDGLDDDRAITSFETNVNGTEILYKVWPSTLPYVYLADDTIDAIFGSLTAKALVDIDGGEIHIYLRVASLVKLSSTEAAL